MSTFVKIMLVSLILIAQGQSQSERSLIRDGNRQYRDNKYSDAEVNYRKALEKNREIHEGAFNLGDALYRQGRFGEAAEQYQSAATRSPDRSDKSQAFHNLGNSLLKAQKIPESIAAYKEALKLSPNDADTKYNLEYAKMMLKQQQQQKKDQKNKDRQKEDKKDQGKQDQKSQDQQKKDQQDQQKQDQQKQDEGKQQQAEQKDDQQRQAQQKKQQISKQDAERILEALKNEEKDVQKKLHKKVPARVRVEKDW